MHASNYPAVDPERIKKILIIRTDRIGDLVLTLPMFPALKYRFPDAKIDLLVRGYTRGIVEGNRFVNSIIEYQEVDSFSSMMRLVRVLNENRYDAAIVAFPRFPVVCAIAIAGIPIRIGSGYRWYSFLFNRKVFEHRKYAEFHEAEYNLHLLRTLGIDNAVPEFIIFIPAEARRRIDDFLCDQNIDPHARFAVIHPGSGGSARDWKPERFAALADLLAEKMQLKIIITGSRNDAGVVRKVVSSMRTVACRADGLFSIKELAGLTERAALFVSNSTGPLHIAAATGAPVIGFYPPIMQCSPRRWGPWTGRKKIFTADNLRCDLCKGGPCRSDHCMDQISVEEVYQAARELIGRD